MEISGENRTVPMKMKIAYGEGLTCGCHSITFYCLTSGNSKRVWWWRRGVTESPSPQWEKRTLWWDSCAVVTCAKICCDLMAGNEITARLIYHRIWITSKNSLLKRPQHSAAFSHSHQLERTVAGWNYWFVKHYLPQKRNITLVYFLFISNIFIQGGPFS